MKRTVVTFMAHHHSRRSRSHAPAATLPVAPEPGAPRWAVRPLAELLVAFFSGLVFAAGLTLSGLTQPERVLALLDVKEMMAGPFPGQWDPALLLVVVGAALIGLLGYTLTPLASLRPWFTRAFMLTQRPVGDGRMVAGAVLFGLGWGLCGYSPATALAALLTGQLDTVVFVLAMLPGMWLAKRL